MKTVNFETNIYENCEIKTNMYEKLWNKCKICMKTLEINVKYEWKLLNKCKICMKTLK